MSVYLCISAFFMSYFLAKLFYSHAEKLGFVAYPNHRSSHTMPTFTAGGVAFVVSFLALSYFASLDMHWWLNIFLGTSLLAIISIIDDKKHVSAIIRLGGQMIAVMILYYCAYAYFQQHSLFFSLFFIVASVWFINLFNFMDGINTIAALEAIVILLCACIQLYYFSSNYPLISIFLLAAAAIVGFLPWNMSPAKLFMGDVGSVSLAFIILSLALLSMTQSALNIYSWLILLAMFWLDATITLLVRIYRNEAWHQAHCSHFYQKWAKQCKNHVKVSLTYMLINIVWLFPMSCFSLRYPEYGLYCMFIAICPIAAFFYGITRKIKG